MGLVVAPILLADSFCINTGYGKEYKWDKVDKQYLINNCDNEIFTFWCHDKDQKGYRKGVCGGEKFFRNARVIKAGEKYFNQYSIPKSANINFGACPTSKHYKWSRSVKKWNEDGSYECMIEDISDRKLNDKTIEIQCNNNENVTVELVEWKKLRPSIIRYKNPETKHVMTINLSWDEKKLVKQLCGDIKVDSKLFPKFKQKIRDEIKKHDKLHDENRGKGSQGVRG